MISFEDLLNRCIDEFSWKNPTLARLLYVWTTDDQNDELAAYLASGGVDLGQLVKVLEPFLTLLAKEDQQILGKLIREYSEQLITGWHLLKMLVQNEKHPITLALVDKGLDLQAFKKALDASKPVSSSVGYLDRFEFVKTKCPNLLHYAQDLTELAKLGKFDDICICEDDLNRLCVGLKKKNRGNIALTGPAGIGKTACVEGLARQIALGHEPGWVSNKKIIHLDICSLVAGTRYRGELEERAKLIIEEVLSDPDIILFIDELHLIVGAGRAEGAPMDLSNILKPHLARGDIHVIGATTIEEYSRYIASDGALARRFEEVRLEEPSGERLRKIVLIQSEGLAQHHNITISHDIIDKAIELTNNYVPNRYQPDKTIELLDTTASRLARLERKEMTANDLVEILSKDWKCPIVFLDPEGERRLENIEKGIRKKIIGQDHAIHQVVSALRLCCQGLGRSDRNLGAYLFAGDTGVGKTEFGRVLAQELFGDTNALLHLDCAEYSNPISITELLGTPNGYVGCDREGVLTCFVRDCGRGVIIFDEIEKASEELRKLLLGMLDNGRIRSARGEQLDTRMCIIIATTNALTPEELTNRSFGFGNTGKKSNAFELLKRHFSEEWLSRYDEHVIFNSLDSHALREILRLRLREAFERLEEKGIHVTCCESSLIIHLEEELNSINSGARGIVRLLERKVLQPLAGELLKRGPGRPILIRLDEVLSWEKAALVARS